MATLTFPPSDQSPFEGPNGVTYIWNGNGYWEASGDSLNDIYLSKTGDDTAAGAITFEGQTTHETGVNVTGGRVLAEGSETQLFRAIQSGAKDQHTGFWSAAESGSSTTGLTRGFFASATLAVNSDGAESIRGYESNIDNRPGQDNNYNFYASGNALNFFAGNIQCGGAAGTDPYGSNAATMFHAGMYTDASDGNIMVKNGSAGTDGPACVSLNRNGSQTGRFVNFYKEGTRQNGRIQANADGTINYNVGASDYRAKQNIADMESATEKIKNLRPVSFQFKQYPEHTSYGFLAHEVQEQIPYAAFGVKDEVETYGTYTAPDGVVEADVSEPEAVPYGATFVAEGTREVYQSISETRLIPFLTKALQEALARIETLEADVATLQGN